MPGQTFGKKFIRFVICMTLQLSAIDETKAALLSEGMWLNLIPCTCIMSAQAIASAHLLSLLMLYGLTYFCQF
jgi:hypothetical protein